MAAAEDRQTGPDIRAHMRINLALTEANPHRKRGDSRRGGLKTTSIPPGGMLSLRFLSIYLSLT